MEREIQFIQLLSYDGIKSLLSRPRGYQLLDLLNYDGLRRILSNLFQHHKAKLSFMQRILRCPRLNFIRLHWAYFILMPLLCSAVFWATSTRFAISYVDSLFLAVAAMTQAGLNPINLSTLSTFQQALLLLLIICGNQIFVSAIVVHVRKRAFGNHFGKRQRESEKSTEWEREKERGNWPLPRGPVSLHRHQPSDVENIRATQAYYRPSISIQCQKNHGHISIHGTVDRNALFHGLSYEEIEHVHCVEYQAVKLLGWLVPTYFIIWQVVGCIALGVYLKTKRAEVAQANDLNPWWVGTFFGVAAFNNAGMSLIDLSAIPFQNSVFTLTTLIFLTLAGNTAYPIFLRFTLYVMLRLLPRSSRFDSFRDTLQFILRYPRRVYTNLFPTTQTRWLLFMLIILNAIDWTFFETLNMHNTLINSIPVGYRLLDGLFQAFAVRSSGFAIISISNLAVGLQVLYMMMMYISAYPVTITMRNSNVYEERSLGIYVEDSSSTRNNPADSKHGNTVKRLNSNTNLDGSLESKRTKHDKYYFIRTQLRAQLGHDMWFLTVACIAITILETQSYNTDPQTFALFNIIFEVVSAYGCVGLSIGLPNQAYSFCGAWRAVSKCVLILVMLRGRHRGLPVEIDRAIQLPGQNTDVAEKSDWKRGEQRRSREKEIWEGV